MLLDNFIPILENLRSSGVFLRAPDSKKSTISRQKTLDGGRSETPEGNREHIDTFFEKIRKAGGMVEFNKCTVEHNFKRFEQMMSLLMKTDACTTASEPHDLDLWENLADFFIDGGGMGVMKVILETDPQTL